MQNYGQQEITSLKLSKESHIYWKDHSHKSPIFFTIIAEFESDNEIEDGHVLLIKQLKFISKTRYFMNII